MQFSQRKQISAELNDLLKKMLEKQPSKRCSALDVMVTCYGCHISTQYLTAYAADPSLDDLNNCFYKRSQARKDQERLPLLWQRVIFKLSRIKQDSTHIFITSTGFSYPFWIHLLFSCNCIFVFSSLVLQITWRERKLWLVTYRISSSVLRIPFQKL